MIFAITVIFENGNPFGSFVAVIAEISKSFGKHNFQNITALSRISRGSDNFIFASYRASFQVIFPIFVELLKADNISKDDF